jgi:phosphoglycolate phosphatase-like HAD superfamily hydrolase
VTQVLAMEGCLQMDDLPRVNGDLVHKSDSAVHFPGADTAPFTIEAAIADALDRLTSDPAADSTAGVQHWIWTGHRLVRASPEAVERLRQQEAWEQAEFQLLHEMQKAYRQRRRQSYRRIARRLVAPLRHLLASWTSRIHNTES